MNSAKSSNPNVRTNAASLFETIIQKAHQDADIDATVKELLALPKAGKTSGPDHRVTLYTMLGSVKRSSTVSAAILETGLPLLAKETHDAAVSALAAALIPHLSHCLSENIPISPAATAVLGKEMNSAKVVIRRATCNLVAEAFASLRLLERPTAAAEVLGRELLPSFETNLKTVASSPLASPAGPLEGYTAIATVLGRISTSPGFGEPIHMHSAATALTVTTSGEFIARNATLQSLLTVGAKPSFLLWDKVYQKISSLEEENWLLYAAEATLLYFNKELTQNEQAWSVTRVAHKCQLGIHCCPIL